jgi:hypothetical protein
MDRDIIVGKTYRHLSGNYFRVICIANDSTTKDGDEPRQLVVYESLGNDHKIWVRPYDMFNQLVEDDDSVQKYRFELVDDKIHLD